MEANAMRFTTDKILRSKLNLDAIEKQAERVPQFKNYPLQECVNAGVALMMKGWTIHQKFSCEACGSRQTIARPNMFYELGTCEACGHTSDIKKAGCNYTAIFGGRSS